MKGKNLLFVLVLCLATAGAVVGSDSAWQGGSAGAATSSKGASATTSSLTRPQAALYLICISATSSPVALSSGTLAIPTSLVSQYRQLSQLSGLNIYALGVLESSVLPAYATAAFPGEKTSKAEKDALKQFATFTDSECLSTASGFTPPAPTATPTSTPSG